MEYIKLYDKFLSDKEILNVSKTNKTYELLDKEGLKELYRLIKKDDYLSKFCDSKNPKVRSGEEGIAILMDKYVIKITTEKQNIDVINFIKNYKGELKYIYNFPYDIRKINYRNQLFYVYPMDKLRLLNEEERNIFDFFWNGAGYYLTNFNAFYLFLPSNQDKCHTPLKKEDYDNYFIDPSFKYLKKAYEKDLRNEIKDYKKEYERTLQEFIKENPIRKKYIDLVNNIEKEWYKVGLDKIKDVADIHSANLAFYKNNIVLFDI